MSEHQAPHGDTPAPTASERISARWGYPLPPLKGGAGDAGTEGAAASEATTSTEAQEAAEQAVVDWEKRYNDIRPQFDRVTGRNSELEQREQWFNLLATSEDPDTRRQAAEALGYEVEGDDEPQEPDAQLAQRLEKLEQTLSKQAEDAQQNARIAQVEQHVDTALAGLDGLDDSDRDWVVARAVALPPTEAGMPDIAAAHAEFVALEGRLKQRWATTKRAPQTVVGGTQATQAVDPATMTHQERVDHIMARLNADQ